MQFKALFSPIKIGNMDVKNRFVIPPMGTNLANPDGTVSDNLIAYWTTRAKGGWGLLITEYITVDPIGKGMLNQLCIYDDKFIPGLKKLADTVHAYGTKIAAQIHHSGRMTKYQITGTQPVAPSPIPCPVYREIPRELSIAEIYELIEKFGDAAARLREAGFDAVEIHGATGYLIAQFMSAYTNKRTDIFGGSFPNRMRFPLEIISNIRSKVGADFPLSFRLAADENIIGGRSLEESKVVARVLEEAGVDAIHVSFGVMGSRFSSTAPASIPPGFLLPATGEIKKSVSVPVITIGRINDPYLAESAIENGQADLLAWGRTSLADPQIPNKVAAGKINEICPCIGCLQGCVSQIHNLEKLRVACLVNPFCGKEAAMKLTPAQQRKKVLIVGGGPGGLEAAWIAASRGHQVTLYERRSKLGGQFRVGAIPPAKQDIARIINYWIHMCDKYGVHFHLNTEATAEQILAEKPDAVILATGGEPLVPDIKGITGNNVVTALEVLEGKRQVGPKVLVVGGGMVGCETADFLGEHAHEVAIIEMLPAIAGDIPRGVKTLLLERLTAYNVRIETGVTVKEFLEDGLVGERDGGELRFTGFDTIVLAMGVRAVNTLKREIEGKVAELYEIGDAVLPRKAMEAIEEGAKVALKI